MNNNAESMHITIQEGRSLPDLQRCITCCEDFHCPFCASDLFRPARLGKVQTHLESHLNRSAVLHEGYTIYRCGLNCRPGYHFHCLYCKSMLARKANIVKHLALCKAKHSAITPIITDPAIPIIRDPAIPIITDPAIPIITDPAIPIIPRGKMQRVHAEPVLKKKCPLCHVLINKKNVKRHMERKHSAERKDITLPEGIICRILMRVVLEDGDPAICTLALTCERFNYIVSQGSFQKEAHFNWLYSVVNWNVFSEGHKQEYRKAYQISRCFQCDSLYKDVGTGYRGSGRRGTLQGFFSEEGFPGYCSWSCFLVAEGTTDPASPQ